MSERLHAIYHVRAEASTIAVRARGIAVEQSVEMPLSAIEDSSILSDIVGQVENITDQGNGIFTVRIALAAVTIGDDAGQLLNMAFGNTSLHDDVVLHDILLPPNAFPGPKHGLKSLRARCGAATRALTCSALKPQGLTPDALARLAARFARGGVDFIKDDHGLADQEFSPFATRVGAIAAALRAVARETGRLTHYIPSLSGDLDTMRRHARLARDEGLACIMLAPMIAGVTTLRALARDFLDMAIFAHPALSGAARIAPDLLIGKLFPAFGADAVIFPTYGGRFGYSQATCQNLANTARALGSLPIPAGGMTLARVPEILDFYGMDTMLLIGGSLLDAKERLTEETGRFVHAVATH
ncbi:MAG: ribulose 1,5-bisphosphate carboxylase [Acetobacteraceae bacterium]|nr:ribulose 1,5-bisphosphate carboxylase [Acetobacteraceae bacterium]MSP29166.1 ribulose 1,5-bisphosphate carboxylase [Acetobacteraceae bacterium]